jgi:hypothetical protein
MKCRFVRAAVIRNTAAMILHNTCNGGKTQAASQFFCSIKRLKYLGGYFCGDCRTCIGNIYRYIAAFRVGSMKETLPISFLDYISGLHNQRTPVFSIASKAFVKIFTSICFIWLGSPRMGQRSLSRVWEILIFEAAPV